jgi:methyl-accepting chemotaxis protein
LDTWVLVVLIVIGVLIESRWRSANRELVRVIRELKEELEWFKKDNFAEHLFKEMKENCDTLERQITEAGEEIEQQLQWFKKDNFAEHLFKEMRENSENLQQEMKENCETLQRELTETNQALQQIAASLDDLKEIVSAWQEAQAR